MRIFRRTMRACLLTAASFAALSGCGEESSIHPASAGVAVKANTPAEIAQDSADDYDSNLNGLITAHTLKRWIGNWERERPAGITGNLIIIQASEGPPGFRFIRPNNVDVFTYVESGWSETRSNGVTEIATGGLSGAALDRLIAEYGINVSTDLIVCAQGGATPNSYFGQGLCWYTWRYWGVDHRHLAVLSGSNAHLGNAHLGEAWSPGDFSQADFIPALPGQPSPTNAIRRREVVSVKSLRVDNTSLQATLGDLIRVLPARDENNVGDGVFLWDARSLEEYSAGEATEAGLPSVVPLADRFASVRNGGSRQGHPRGAVNLGWQHLLDTGTGLFKSRAELSAYLLGRTDSGNRGFVDGQYLVLGEGKAWQPGDVIYVWSETSARAAVAQVVAAVILGLPTRLYEGGTIEWNSLTGDARDRDGTPLLPANSPWRTDTLSSPGLANLAGLIEPRNAWSDTANPKVPVATVTQPRILTPFAPDTGAAVRLDRAYLRSADDGVLPDDGGGKPLLPPNPCGG